MWKSPGRPVLAVASWRTIVEPHPPSPITASASPRPDVLRAPTRLFTCSTLPIIVSHVVGLRYYSELRRTWRRRDIPLIPFRASSDEEKARSSILRFGEQGHLLAPYHVMDKPHFIARRFQNAQRLAAKGGYSCPSCMDTFQAEPKLWAHARLKHSDSLGLTDNTDETEKRERFRQAATEKA